MGLEVSTYLAGLNSSWPLGTDKFRDGDNHIRLVKSVLLNQFSGLASDGAPTGVTLTSVQFNNLSKAVLTDDSKTPGMTVTFESNILGSVDKGATFRSQIEVDQSDGSLATAPAAAAANFAGLVTLDSGVSFNLYTDGKATSTGNYIGVYGAALGTGSGGVVSVAGRATQEGTGVAYAVEGFLHKNSTDSAAVTCAGIFTVTTHKSSLQVATGVIISNQNVEYTGGLPATVDSPTRALHIEGNTSQTKGYWDQGILLEDCLAFGMWQRLQSSWVANIIDHKYWWAGGGSEPSAPANSCALLIRSGDWATATPGVPQAHYGIQVNGTFNYAAIRVLDNQGIAFDDNGRYQIKYTEALGFPAIIFWDRISNVIRGYIRMDTGVNQPIT